MDGNIVDVAYSNVRTCLGQPGEDFTLRILEESPEMFQKNCLTGMPSFEVAGYYYVQRSE